MNRNKQTVYYSLFDKKEEIKDENGLFTGAYKIVYKTPVKMAANVSAATGSAQAELFGANISYDKVIVIDDTMCPIDENTVLCVDSAPEYDSSGNLIFDYVVKRVAKSLNSISYAISRAVVS